MGMGTQCRTWDTVQFTTQLPEIWAWVWVPNVVLGNRKDQTRLFIHFRLINCRLFCRKGDIVSQCQETGFEAAKSLVRALGQLLQRFSDPTSHNQLVGPLTI